MVEFIIRSSNGDITIDYESGAVIDQREWIRETLIPITRFDADKFKLDFPKHRILEADILDWGYWYFDTDDEVYKYERPYRKEEQTT